jgi:phytoene synthase
LADADAGDDLDQLIRRVDPDRWLTSRFIGDPAARADVVALYAYDHELARARRVASNPLMAEIRLTWWREVLDEAFAGGSVRRHPVAEALAAAIRRRGLPRAPLEAMIDGQIEALEIAEWDADGSIRCADAVEGSAAMLAALVLDPQSPSDAAKAAGRAWGLVLLRRSGTVEAVVSDALLRQAIAEARDGVRALSAAAFPAALPLRIARLELGRGAAGPLARRLALVLAVALGRA